MPDTHRPNINTPSKPANTEVPIDPNAHSIKFNEDESEAKLIYADKEYYFTKAEVLEAGAPWAETKVYGSGSGSSYRGSGTSSVSINSSVSTSRQVWFQFPNGREKMITTDGNKAFRTGQAGVLVTDEDGNGCGFYNAALDELLHLREIEVPKPFKPKTPMSSVWVRILCIFALIMVWPIGLIVFLIWFFKKLGNTQTEYSKAKNERAAQITYYARKIHAA